MKVPKEERMLLEKLELLRQVSGEVWQREKALKESGKCTHSITRTYNWQHDDGYGRQIARTGLVCIACGTIDAWKTGKFRHPEDE